MSTSDWCMVEVADDSASCLVKTGDYTVGVSEFNSDIAKSRLAFRVDQAFGIDDQLATNALYICDSCFAAFNVAVITVSGWANCGEAIDSDEDLRRLGRGVEHLKWDWLESEVCPTLLRLRRDECGILCPDRVIRVFLDFALR